LGAPASGATVTMGGADVFRVVEGRIAERWPYPDRLSMLQQIGAVRLGGE
jgi:predicted SnoaL-like aldol condensation-catalyzing enzyme